MRKTLTLAALSMACVAAAVPARAQNFLNTLAEPITPGYLRLAAFPTEMFGRDGAPDRFGGALRLGYGVNESLGLEAKAAVFDGVSLLGGDADVRLLGGDTRLLLRFGGHEALVRGAPDTTALDLAGTLGRRVSSRLVAYGGASYSYELTHDSPAPNFSRAYVVPGLQLQVARNLALAVEGGIGLTDNSPHYVGGGFSLLLPASSGSSGRR